MKSFVPFPLNGANYALHFQSRESFTLTEIDASKELPIVLTQDDLNSEQLAAIYGEWDAHHKN